MRGVKVPESRNHILAVPKEYRNKYLRKWIPKADADVLFNEEHTTPKPGTEVKSTKTAVVNTAKFGHLFDSKRDLEFKGLKVNRLMIDVAYAIVATGTLETIATDYSTRADYIRKKCLACPDFQALLNHFCEAVVGELKAGMVNSAGKALNLLDELVVDKDLDPALRFKVAQDILDRTGVKEDKKSVIDVNNNVNFMAHMSQAEAMEYADFDMTEVIDVEQQQIGNGSEETRDS